MHDVAVRALEKGAHRVDLIGLVKDKFGHAEQVDMAVAKLKEMIPDGPVAPPAQ